MRVEAGAAVRLRAVAAASALAVMCACLSTAGAAAGSSRAAAGITVYAASSLTDAFPAIDKRNSYSFGGSNALATQIANGAPADVFASANTSLPAQLYAAGVVEKPVVFTRNTLVVVVPKSNPARIESVYDLTKPGLKIDVANPAVPVGAYTLQVLDQMGLRASVTPNIVSQETDVRTVLSKVQLGQADAGFVYATDARTVSGQVAVVKVPAWAQPKVAYSLAIVSRSQNKAAAQAFVAEVLSKAGQAKLVGFGFLPVGAPVPTLTAIAPRRGSWGATVTLTGTNFTGATSVTFHGVPARFTVRSATRIVVTVPARARTGRITVTNPAGTATSSTSFRVP
jgi:molybdate transport system substrate-binding protein